jgi:hypothetical protein
VGEGRWAGVDPPAAGEGEIKAVHDFDEIVGQCGPVLAVLDKVRKVAPTDASVLITGETGTGKELFARAIHSASARAEKPLIKVNCAALPTGLVESELFGHEKGAFSGAIAWRIGRFELAHGGTIFWMKLAKCRRTCRLNCCESYRSGSLSAWAAGRLSKRMCESSQRRIGICAKQ